VTLRLVGLARREWASLDGEMASQNVDTWAMAPDRFLNLIYWWATRNGEADAVAKFDRRLWMPPKGVAPAPGSPWSPEAETAAFGELAAAFGVGTTAKARQGGEVAAT
jgi:hypothetical protein